jgi:hypothetical protein
MNRPAKMSQRARGYLIVAAAHFTVIGTSILVWPEMYNGAAFIPMVQATGLLVWGIGYSLVGLLCIAAAITRWPTFARAGLIGAFAVLIASAAAIGFGCVKAWFDGNPATTASPIIPISFAALAFKDLLLVEQPLRTPAEDYEQAAAELEAS